MTLGLRTGLAAAGLALVLGLAACGGSSGSGGSEVAKLDDASQQAAASTTTTSTSTSPADFQDAMLEFTQCLRDQGLDVEDPDFSAGPGGGGFLGNDLDQDDPDVQAAMEECRPLLQSSRPQLSEEDMQAMQDAVLEYAKCMREHGVDMPDPDFSGDAGPGAGGLFGDVNRDDPDFQAADEACRDALQNAMPGPPGGGAPPAGGTGQ